MTVAEAKERRDGVEMRVSVTHAREMSCFARSSDQTTEFEAALWRREIRPLSSSFLTSLTTTSDVVRRKTLASASRKESARVAARRLEPTIRTDKARGWKVRGRAAESWVGSSVRVVSDFPARDSAGGRELEAGE